MSFSSDGFRLLTLHTEKSKSRKKVPFGTRPFPQGFTIELLTIFVSCQATFLAIVPHNPMVPMQPNAMVAMVPSNGSAPGSTNIVPKRYSIPSTSKYYQ